MKVNYSHYTDESFKDAEELQNFFRSGKLLKYDYVIVAGILFTMHEFDSEGESLNYVNKKHGKMVEVFTGNRYGDKGWSDAEVFMYEAYYIRNDINFAE